MIYKFSMSLIRKHLPKRVLFVNHWLRFLSFTDNGPLHESAQCYHGLGDWNLQSFKDIEDDINKYTKAMKEIRDLGIDVYVATINPQGARFDPGLMFDLNGIV
jgi:hypothetical protein